MYSCSTVAIILYQILVSASKNYDFGMRLCVADLECDLLTFIGMGTIQLYSLAVDNVVTYMVVLVCCEYTYNIYDIPPAIKIRLFVHS